MQSDRSTSEEEGPSPSPISDSSPERKIPKSGKEGMLDAVSSPEPSMHEAETLRRRLELEAREEDNAEASWIEEREVEVRKLSATPGDVEALKAKMKQCDS